MSYFLTEPCDINGKMWLPGFGNPQAKIMIVGAYPSQQDFNAREVFRNGHTGRELRNALKAAGLKEEDLWFTTMVKFNLGKKTKPTSEQIEECAPYLDAEIEQIKPTIIISLGGEVFKRIMKLNIKVSSFHGEIIDCPYGCKLLANHAPGTVFMQDPTKRPDFQEIFLAAKNYAIAPPVYKPYRYLVVDRVDVAEAIVDYYIKNNKLKVGYDAEWFGEKYNVDRVMYTFQFSCEEDVAIILDISKDGYTENRELLNTVKPLICHPNAWRLGWNIRADDKELIHRGFVIPDETLKMDGMKAMAFYDSRWSKGLETGVKRFTSYEPYWLPLVFALRKHHLDYSEMSKLKMLEPDIFYKYSGGDAVSHRTACLNIIEFFPKEHRNLFYNIYLPFTTYLIDMEMTGLPVDINIMEDITNKYVAKFDELKTKLLELLTLIDVKEFNPNSAPQKKKLLYETLGITPAYYTKSGKSPKPRAWYIKQKEETQELYSPSTNSKSLSTIVFELKFLLQQNNFPDEVQKKVTELRYSIISSMLDMNRVSVFANKFLSKRGIDMEDFDIESITEEPELGALEEKEEEPLKQSYWAALCKTDLRIHADFFECLKNFRSSSRVNVQNPASKVLSHMPRIFIPNYENLKADERKAQEKILVPKNIRNVFYTGTDPNFRFAEVDVQGADLMIAAYLSRDNDYITDMLQGGFHLKKARQYYNDETVSKDDASRYVSAKSITFRVAYTASLESAAEPIQAEIFAESGYLMPLATVQNALKTWYNYKRYMEYREQCVSSALNLGYIENARGVKLLFEATDNGSIKASYANQSLAFPIAAELPLFLYEVSVEMRKYFIKENLWMKYIFPCNQVHDASYWIIHKDLLKGNYFPDVCKYFFCERIKIATGDVLGLEINISDRWKGKNVDYANETKWSFEQKKWLWSK